DVLSPRLARSGVGRLAATGTCLRQESGPRNEQYPAAARCRPSGERPVFGSPSLAPGAIPLWRAPLLVLAEAGLRAGRYTLVYSAIRPRCQASLRRVNRAADCPAAGAWVPRMGEPALLLLP